MTWIHDAQKELERLETGDPIQDTHLVKKQTTILAIVSAKVNQEPINGVFEQEGTVSKTIYYQKWQHDPQFMEVLTAVLNIALKARSGLVLTALEIAQQSLALATPEAVDRLVEVVRSGNNTDARQAAVAILDRADVGTAHKSSVSNPELAQMLDEVWGDEDGED